MPDARIQGHPSRPPCPRGESGRRGVSVPSPSPCPQGCCQPRGQDLSVGSSLLLSQPTQPTQGAAVGWLDLLGFLYSTLPLWGTPCSLGGPCNPASHQLSPWCQTNSVSPASVSLAVNERGIFLLLPLFWFLHGLFLFTERGRRKQLIVVLWQRRSVLRSPRCLPESRGAPQHPETQGLNLSSWLPEAADASPSHCWEEVTGPILSPRGSSG